MSCLHQALRLLSFLAATSHKTGAPEVAESLKASKVQLCKLKKWKSYVFSISIFQASLGFVIFQRVKPVPSLFFNISDLLGFLEKFMFLVKRCFRVCCLASLDSSIFQKTGFSVSRCRGCFGVNSIFSGSDRDSREEFFSSFYFFKIKLRLFFFLREVSSFSLEVAGGQFQPLLSRGRFLGLVGDVRRVVSRFRNTFLPLIVVFCGETNGRLLKKYCSPFFKFPSFEWKSTC